LVEFQKLFELDTASPSTVTNCSTKKEFKRRLLRVFTMKDEEKRSNNQIKRRPKILNSKHRQRINHRLRRLFVMDAMNNNSSD
jgi:hypothetical protein